MTLSIGVTGFEDDGLKCNCGPYDPPELLCPVHGDPRDTSIGVVDARRLSLIERLRLEVAQDDAVLVAMAVIHNHQQEKKR